MIRRKELAGRVSKPERPAISSCRQSHSLARHLAATPVLEMTLVSDKSVWTLPAEPVTIDLDANLVLK